MYWTTKDLALETGLHVRTVKRWWKKLEVPPDGCEGHACHRWTDAGKALFLKRWRQWWRMRGHSPDVQSKKFSGTFKDSQQTEFSFTQNESTSPRRFFTGRMEQTHTRPKIGSNLETEKGRQAKGKAPGDTASNAKGRIAPAR
jgi:hypothetical protein